MRGPLDYLDLPNGIEHDLRPSLEHQWTAPSEVRLSDTDGGQEPCIEWTYGHFYNEVNVVDGPDGPTAEWAYPHRHREHMAIPQDLRDGEPISMWRIREWTDSNRPSHRDDVVTAKGVLRGQSALDAFVRLHDQPAEAFVRFARRWGPLLFLAEPVWLPARSGHGDPERWFRDAVARWRMWSKGMRALLSIAVALHNGLRPTPEDWRDVTRGTQFDRLLREEGVVDYAPEPGTIRTAEQDWKWVLAAVSEWLEHARPCLSLVVDRQAKRGPDGLPQPALHVHTATDSWAGMAHMQVGVLERALGILEKVHLPTARLLRGTIGRPVLGPKGCPVFGNLALELAASLACPNGLVQCDICGTPYTPPNRKARSDRRRYCNDWCRRQGATERNRESRQRQRARRATAAVSVDGPDRAGSEELSSPS